MINWALCVPDACSASDVEAALHETIAAFTDGTGIRMRARVEARMCQTADTERTYDRNTRWAAAFFAAIVAWTLLSTALDCLCTAPSKYGMVLDDFLHSIFL